MDFAHQLEKLALENVSSWNEWRKQNPGIPVIMHDETGYANLCNRVLPGVDLRGADLSMAAMVSADLSGAKLYDANLSQADLSKANLTQANLSKADLSEANLKGAVLCGADLTGVNMSGADLRGADLSRVSLSKANLCGANLERVDLSYAKIGRATLIGANLHRAILREADLREADLSGVNLSAADLSGASLDRANLNKASLNSADLSRASLYGADLRSANLHDAHLDEAIATNIRLWETLRAGWSIKGIECKRAYWDEDGTEPTVYLPGEFERLYSNQTCIELFYQGGVSIFELSTLPALLYHLASLHPGSDIRLKSIEETGGGARISISVGDSDPETAEKIKADAMQVYRAQLALRDKETERLQIERDYIERLFIGKLIPAMLNAGAPQNIFNAPVTGVAISSGESKVDFHQTVNDNTALLSLLEKMMNHRTDLGLASPDAVKFQSELHSATAEVQKKNPDKSILSKSLELIQKLATEAASKAAGKLGESAVTDWQTWLHQLGQLAHHLK